VREGKGTKGQNEVEGGRARGREERKGGKGKERGGKEMGEEEGKGCVMAVRGWTPLKWEGG